MKAIQVDMFAVGLGASVLTQFALENGTIVTILADAGFGPGHAAGEVSGKLGKAFSDFRSQRSRRIDLIVGTHYDGDHLKGLVPIIEDESIEIGEVWLPPIKNDTEEIPGPLDADDFLAGQLFDDREDTVLQSYLTDKVSRVEELHRLEIDAAEYARSKSEEDRDFRALPRYRNDSRGIETLRKLRDALRADGASKEERIQAFQAFFTGHEADAGRQLGADSVHENAVYDSRYPDAVDHARKMQNNWEMRRLSRDKKRPNPADYPDRARIAPAAFASIRQATAAHAIRSIHLEAVVEALKKRVQPIRPRCPYVAVERPSRFVWMPEKRRFLARAKGGPSELILTLLGPSEQLVEKYREKLPVGAYFFALMTLNEPIRSGNISASNQLSFIFTVEMLGQRILISGDAGCYGFKDLKREYYPEFLAPLKTLHVLQIAHHGGLNYDFYDALLNAGFGEQEDPSFLLLSHAKHDKTRPSAAFREFISRVRREADFVSLLFTAEPDRDKVDDYDDLIHRVIPAASAAAQEGDIRLSFEQTGSNAWTVERHSIQIV